MANNINTNFYGLPNVEDQSQLYTVLISVAVPAAGTATNFAGSFEQDSVIVNVVPTVVLPAGACTISYITSAATTGTVCTFAGGAAVNALPTSVDRFQVPVSTDGNFLLRAAVPNGGTVSLAVTYCNAH
jgi:hypothetical protein